MNLDKKVFSNVWNLNIEEFIFYARLKIPFHTFTIYDFFRNHKKYKITFKKCHWKAMPNSFKIRWLSLAKTKTLHNIFYNFVYVFYIFLTFLPLHYKKKKIKIFIYNIQCFSFFYKIVILLNQSPYNLFLIILDLVLKTRLGFKVYQTILDRLNVLIKETSLKTY